MGHVSMQPPAARFPTVYERNDMAIVPWLAERQHLARASAAIGK
ncbi:hypothetical protein D083_4413 [Dickeya solani RNS 08.23.3.1.A]|nr:hypothetical protein D083_4413 [Dickeya solani RNS 08.23.3.1.A]